jgi:hypothetical protein
MLALALGYAGAKRTHLLHPRMDSSIELNSVHQGDCIEGMRRLPTLPRQTAVPLFQKQSEKLPRHGNYIVKT